MLREAPSDMRRPSRSDHSRLPMRSAIVGGEAAVEVEGEADAVERSLLIAVSPMLADSLILLVAVLNIFMLRMAMVIGVD